MLNIFRKYQRPLLIGTTVVIVSSFALSSLFVGSNQPKEAEQPVVFTAVDGSQFKRDQLLKMVQFISSDSHDKIAAGGVWGPNFLNNGVVRNDLFANGLGIMLARGYAHEIAPDLQARANQEKYFTPYSHPSAQFLTAQSVWSMWAPEVKRNYEALAAAPLDFSTRVKLYQAEQQFPQRMLKHVLHYQESQYDWIGQDNNMNGQDLSLFGHHTLEDWFGTRYLTLATEFVIDASIIAQERGYKVTKQEAWSELRHNAEESFQKNANSPYVTVANAQQYMDEQLRRMGMERAEAVESWRRVMLFRRLFNDVGQTALIDILPFQKFSEYADEIVDLDIYSLPKGLKLDTFRQMQALECYLDAVAIRGNILDTPATYKSVAQIKFNSPELVQLRYVIDVAEVSRAELVNNIPIKEMWTWQLADANWDQLAVEHPALAEAAPKSRDERFAALKGLDRPVRAQVDKTSQTAIIALHPEWIDEALAQAMSQTREIAIPANGERSPLAGVTDGKALAKLLAQAPLDQPVDHYSAESDHYYRISVTDRSKSDEVMTFAEAMELRMLDKKVNARVGGDDAEKAFSDVIRKVFVAAPATGATPPEATGSYAATHRFDSYLTKAQAAIQREGDLSKWIAPELDEPEGALSARVALEDQWKLEPTTIALRRQGSNQWGGGEVFAMATDSWSEVHNDAGKPAYFFHLNGRRAGDMLAHDKVAKLQAGLAHDAQRSFMEVVLTEISSRGDLSLAELYPSYESL